MPDPPLVAFAVPVYNGAAFLAEALDALRAQTEERWVALVTDNASTDDTAAIAARAAAEDPRIRYHRNATNLGANGNFNHSMTLALGTGAPFVKWAAADDRPHPEYLSACLGALADRPEAVGAHSAFALIDGDGHLFHHDAEAGGFVVAEGDVWAWSGEEWDALGDLSPGRRLFRFLSGETGQSLVYGLFRSAQVAQTLPFDMPGVEDAWCAEMLLRGPLASVDRVLFDQRLHAGSARHMSRRDYIEYETGIRPTGPMLPSGGRALAFARAVRRVPLGMRERAGAWAALARFSIGGDRVKNLVVPGPNNYFGIGAG